MLEKNKDYFEMRVSSTDCAFTQNAATTISIEGFSYDTYFCLPDPGESYVIVSKEKFEKLQESVVYYMALSTRAQYWKDKCEQLQADDRHYRELAKQFEENYNLLFKKTGFDAVEKLLNYLDSEAECDTLRDAIAILEYNVKFARDERRDLSKKLDECEKDYISERDKAEALEKEIGIYSRTLNEWKEGTGCPSPSAAKTLIESGMSWHHAYNEIKDANEKLADDVKSWKNVTGYSTPEDYMHARISGAFHTPFDYTAAWQKATDCDTPEKAKERIKALNERIDESEADYNHLLCTTGFESKSEIEDALDQCGHSTLRKALVDYEFDYEELLKLTGYKSNQDIRVALNYSEQFVYETMRELINSLKRQAKYTNLNWQNSTGFITPEKCGEYIKKLEDKLHRINGISEEG